MPPEQVDTTQTAPQPMEFTEEQLFGLNAAATRQAEGRANREDVTNIWYARERGFVPAAEKAAMEQAEKNRKEAEDLANQQQDQGAQGIISSSDSVVNEEKTITEEVSSLLGDPTAAELSLREASDNYIKLLEDQANQLEQRRKNEIASINASFDEVERKTERAQKSETGSTTVALQRIGGFLGQSASSVGAMLNLAQTHREEMSALAGKRAAAIAEANNAITDKQFELARLKAAEAKSIEGEIYNRRKDFFDKALDLTRENRLQAEAERQAEKDEFERGLDIIGQIGDTVAEGVLSLEKEEDASRYIADYARTVGVDPNLLLGEVNSILAERKEVEKKELINLASKYPGAEIDPNTDNITTATSKIRQSPEYNLNILKAEADIANIYSTINKRVADTARAERNRRTTEELLSDPILGIYTDVTGKVISSTTTAKSILGYANNLLSGKEIVDTSFTGPLLENQIRPSDAEKILRDNFVKLRSGQEEEGIQEADIWAWMASPEAQEMTDDQKRQEIWKAGFNAEDFGIY